MGAPPHLDVLGVVDHDEGVVAATLLEQRELQERGLELQERELELVLLGDSISRLPLAMLEQSLPSFRGTASQTQQRTSIAHQNEEASFMSSTSTTVQQQLQRTS